MKRKFEFIPKCTWTISFLCILLFQLISRNTFAQSTKINITTKSDCHLISPYIYGVNGSYSDSSIYAIRQGGNRWTAYNWESGLSNSGVDYGNLSDSYLSTGIPTTETGYSLAVTYGHNLARNFNQFFLTTVQAQGYVAGLSGTVTLAAPSKYWFKVAAFKNEPLSLIPNVADSFVYIDEYVNYLKTMHGTANKGGINAYSIDNEPDLWYESHPKAQKSPQKIASLIDKTLQTSLAIKSVDSSALVFGPALGNWYACKNFNNNDILWNNIYSARYNDEWFVSMYLDTMRVLSNKNGKRLVDVVDIHWYPEASGADGIKIVNTKGGAEPITKDAIKTRLQNPRSMWDPSYVEKSGFENGTKAIQLINKLKSSINSHFPGTKIAITEYRYGSENHFSGGLALADVLGVYGREGVYFATKWYASGTAMFQSYSKAAFDLYNNYDGKYSSFGKTSVRALTSSNDTLSAFASIDDKGKMHMIIVNKMATSTKSTFNFEDAFYKNAVVYGFDSISATISKRDSIKSISNYKNCNYTLPAYSALHFVFEPYIVPVITKVETDTVNAKKITIVFSLPIKNEVLNIDSFIVNNGVNKNAIEAVSVSNDSIIITLKDAIQVQDTNLILSYKKVLHDNSNVLLEGLTSYSIINMLKGSKPTVISAVLLADGKTIQCVFSKAIISAQPIDIIVKNQKDILAVDLVNTHNDSLIIVLKKRLTVLDSLKGIFYGVTFKDAISLKISDEYPIVNNGPKYSFAVNTSEMINQGLGIKLQFNKLLTSTIDLSKIKVSINDTMVSFKTYVTGAVASLALNKKIEYNDVAKIWYLDNGYIKANDGSYLESFSNILENVQAMPPARITIPAKLENEILYYSVGATSIKTEATASNGKYLQFNTGSKIAYRITTTKDTIFSFNIKYASGNTSIIVKIDSTDIDTIAIPQTVTIDSFLEYGFLKNLTKGNHSIEITDMADPVNFDYIDIQYGDHLPKGVVTNASVGSKGQSLSVDFNAFVKSVPDPSSFTITANGKPIKIASISINKITLNFKLSDTIFKKQSVVLRLTDENIETKNGSTLALFTKTLYNASTIVGEALVFNTYKVYVSGNQLVSDLPSTATITVFDILGKRIISTNVDNGSISIGSIASGCYFVVATNNGETIYQDKIIITK